LNNKALHILIVEDEVIASQYLVNILQSFGFSNIYEASCFEEALKTVKANKINLIFMDINIDGAIDGINSARILNKEYSIPVIYTTAYGDSNSIKEACDSNLYGYLIKPFEANQVESSLLIALKRIDLSHTVAIPLKQNDIVSLENNQKYNLQNRTFYIQNKVINLTKKENDILYVLCKNLNKNISYEILLQYVWEDKNISNSTVRDTVSRLKKKAPDLKIETIINYGYILKQ